MGLKCVQMYVEAYLKPSRLSTVELFLRKSQKSFVVDVSKYASGISFIVEKVCRMSMLVLYSQSQLCQSQKFVIDILVS